MNDDKFTLGHFSGLNDGDEQPASPTPDRASTESENMEREQPSEAAGPIEKYRDDQGVISHPTEKADKQAKFRSPNQTMQAMVLELDKIIPNEFQPRRIFNEEKLEELAQSILENGIIQPLVVQQREDGLYEIIVGERRFRASKLAGLREVPVFVHQGLSSQAKLELAVIENVQRADLNPIEEGKAYQRLIEEFGLRLGEVAKRVGKNESTVSNLIRLLRLPAEIQRALVEGEITEGQARPLLSLKDTEEMLQMFAIIQKQGMKVRDVEAKVREIKRRKIKVNQMFTPDPFLESLENVLRTKLGTRVQVNKRAKGGNISIEFYSDEELRDIIDKIA